MFVSDCYCDDCKKSLHLTGDMNYVSSESCRFSNVHKNHNIIMLPHDKRWEGLHNGTGWNNNSNKINKIDSQEYQDFILSVKQIWKIKEQLNK